jgi:hypothetical protein
VLGQQRCQGGRADLLLAVDEHGDRDAGVAQGAHRGAVHRDPGLVVGRATSVEPAVELDRLEGIGVPLVRVTEGLHVVVRVQQHRRRTGTSAPEAEHGGEPAVGRDDLDVAQPGAGELAGHLGRARVEVGSRRRVCGDRGDADEALEVGADGRQDRRHRLADTH